MLTFRPDFARRIDLPGAGPCPRPVDIDRSLTGFADLVSLRVYSFAQDVVIDGEAETDEVFIVLMSGAADVAVTQGDEPVEMLALDHAGGARAIYLPPHASYRLTAVSDCDIAYARVEPSAAPLPQVRAFAPDAGRLVVIGHATAMDLIFETLRAGEEAPPVADRRLFERFLHVRTANGARASVGGEMLQDWDSVALSAGESAAMTVETGAADILTVSASRWRDSDIETVAGEQV